MAVVALVGATTATVLGEISSDALVGMYGTVLGYVFGRVRNGVENRAERAGTAESLKALAGELLPSSNQTVTDDPEKESPEHTVPGTESEK